MSEDDRKNAQGLGANSAIVVALVATGAYFYTQQAPLEALRPPPLEARFEQKFRAQDIEARLWQDPFDAIAREVKKADPEEKKQCEEGWTKKPTFLPLHCRSPLIDAEGQLLPGLGAARIIAVTAPGASYFEDSETRQRLRYAVLSGLHLERYEPRNEQHIGYFRPYDPERNSVPIAVPYEWFDHEAKKSNGADGNKAKPPILLVWVDEDALSGTKEPQKKISSLMTMLCTSPAGVRCAAPNYKVLGPYSSGVFKQLTLAESSSPKAHGQARTQSRTKIAAASFGAPAPAEAKSDNIQFYAFGPTVSNEQLGVKSLPNWIFRTNGQDDSLARAITAELIQRDAYPGSAEQFDASKDRHIALISERDTLYGREILHTFTKEFQCPHILGKDTPTCLETVNKNELPDWIYTSTYLRGVDGGLPRAGSGEKSKTEDEKSGSNENAKAREVSKARERSFGHDQFDYLRRLAATLKNKDDDLRGRKKGRISAIGILGNDVFDKLLVLRALKPTFPDAVFFTTDYDATLAGQEELQWTRNLVIASTFGPILSARLQGDIPPFRSTYQTAAFLSAQLAVKEEGVKDVDLRNEIKDGVSRPRVFEIDRRGGAIALPIKVDLSDNARADNDGIHPKTADLYTKLHTRNTLGIIGILLLLAAIVSALCWNKMIFYFLRVTCIGLAVILLLGAGVIARWDYFAAAATEHGLGEPLAWTQGISVWPSIALRVIAAILAVCLILDAWREHQDNLKEVHAEFFAVEGKAADKPDAKFFGERPGPFSVTWDMLSYRLLESNERGRVRIGDAWKVYATKSALWPSVYRIAVYVLLMLMLFTFLTYLFEPPNVPWRGKLREVYQDVTTPVVFFMLILIFLVVDSTLLCLRFVDVLRKHETLWPRETHRPFERRLKFQDPLLDEWIDLNFIAKRTNCISKLIYFPFAIFALMIMARSTAFAEFALNVPIIATQAIAFAIIFGCALALCISAEKARETAKTRLTERLVAVRARIGSDRKVSQLEMLLKLVDNLRQGSFVPLSQQPPIRALLLPIGGLGWTALLDYRLLPGL